MKYKDAVYIIIVIAILLCPLVLTNREEGAVSDIDNQVLPGMPTIGMENYCELYEEYLNNRIGLRSSMIKLYGIIENSVMGELSHPLYTYGKDGYIFFTLHDNITFQEYHEQFANMVCKMQKYCDDRGVKFYFVFEPEKASTLREYLPQGINYEDSWADELISYIRSNGVTVVDNKQLFTEIKNEETLFNKKYDAGHWNDRGCFLATNNLLSEINKSFPRVTTLTEDEFIIHEVLQRDLPVSNYTVNEYVPKYEIKAKYDDYTADYGDELQLADGFKYFHDYVPCAEESSFFPKVLMFQGSYYNGRPQFIVSRTSEYIGIHNYQNVINLDYYYNIFQPEVVVFEVAEYTLSEAFFNSERMNNISWNPALIKPNTGIPVEDQLNTLLSDSKEISRDLSLKIVPGAKLTECFCNRKLNSIKNAYIIIKDIVIDLKQDQKILTSTVANYAINNNDDVILLLVKEDGSKEYVKTLIKLAEPCEKEIVISNNDCIRVNNNSIIFHAEDSGINYSIVDLQLCKADGVDIIESIATIGREGLASNIFINVKKSGWYVLRLRGDENARDEYIDCKVYLEKNRVYKCVMDISSLGKQEIIIDKFELYQ